MKKQLGVGQHLKSTSGFSLYTYSICKTGMYIRQSSLVKFENILIAPRCSKSHTLFSHFEHFIQDKVKMKAFRGVIFIAL